MDVTAPLNPSALFSGKDLVVVITGGGSGIGLAFASTLLQTSAKRIYILGRRADALSKAALSIDPSQKTVTPLTCDVTSLTSISAVIQQVEKDVGYVDVLINNAGISGPRNKTVYTTDSLAEVQKDLLSGADQWEATMATNTTAVSMVSASFLHLLDAGNKRRGYATGKITDKPRPRDVGVAKSNGVEDGDERSSQIITVSSISAFNRHITAGMAYTASKSAAVMIGKTLATLLAPWGIRSNVICPGLYPSEMTSGQKTEYAVNEVPACRQGNFNDIASTLLYLVGQSGAYVNGAVQITDGGRLGVHNGTF